MLIIQILQSYINEVAAIPAIRATNKFAKFIGQSQSSKNNSGIDSSPQTMIDNMFIGLTPQSKAEKRISKDQMINRYVLKF